MGTRAVVHVFDEFTGDAILHLFRQYDGGPRYFGKALYDFLKDIVMVQGIGLIHSPNIANGMGCLAAQIVAHFKDGPGGVYLVGPGEHNQDFTYCIDMEYGFITIKVWLGNETIFEGTIEQFGDFCSTFS